MLSARPAVAVLLAASLSWGARAGADSDRLPDAPAGVTRNDIPLWDNPEVMNDPAKRELFEYVPMFDHQRAKPPWRLRVFGSHPEMAKHPEKLPPTLLLGDLLFHAPALLGPHAAFFGMSCASCHPNGAATVDIDIGTQTDLPGTVDMTAAYFTPLADDGVLNPRNVPSLRGARYTAPFGHGGSVPSVGDFVDHVVSQELAQPPIRRDWRDALAVYIEQLDFLPNAALDPLGRLTPEASAAAHRGEQLFAAGRPAFDGLSCASCHVPESYFTDRRSHALHHGATNAAPGEGFDTPTLLNLAETPPYFYDGTADTLAHAVDKIDARHKLGLSDPERADLTAYLEVVGAAEPASIPTVEERVVHPLAYLSLLIAGPLQDDAQLWPICLDTVRHELHGVVRDTNPGSKAALEPAVRAFEQFAANAGDRVPNAANRAALTALRDRIQKAVARSGKAAR